MPLAGLRALVAAIAVFLLPPAAVADQHILLDTTKESMLDWTRYPYGPQSPTPGWVEESFTNFEKGINWRSYVVCDVGYQNVNNWLWTPFITRHDANRIYIEIKFSLRNCDLFPGTALQCKETFSLLYYEFDAATREPPPWQPESYKQIDVIAADEGRFTNNNEVIINTETRSIDVTKKGVYFAFRDQGACLSLLAVKVYYLKCPEITVGFARYPETATGSMLTSIEKIPGRCVENSVAVHDPHNLCKADGTWSFHTGSCSCMAGYEASDSGRECKACPVGRFKDSVGDDTCHICPAHSQALFGGSVECRCNDGFYRAPGDSKSDACTRPPSAPQNLHFRFVDDTSTKIRLFWDPPLDEGARADTRYAVSCPGCASRPTLPPEMTQTTSVLVTNLQKGLSYTFVVTAHNGVSNLSSSATDKSRSSEITVTTESSGSVVSKMRVVDIKPSQVELSWQPPSDPLGDIEVYEVKYFERGSNESETFITKTNVANIKNLKEGTEYAFQVRAQTSNGEFGDFNRAVFKVTGQESDPVFVGEEESTQIRIAVGVIVTILILVALALTMYFVFKRTMLAERHVEKDADNYRGMDNPFAGTSETLPIVQTHTSSLAHQGAIYNPFSSHKTYVDPHTYEDPHVAVKQFAKEIDSKYITIEAIIGGGEFGDVCRGRLSVPDRNDMLVAIKTLKPGSADKAKIDFLTEASIMGQFEHPNVIFLQGVVTKANPIMIITEYMENGSLDTFLRANDGKFQVSDKPSCKLAKFNANLCDVSQILLCMFTSNDPFQSV